MVGWDCELDYQKVYIKKVTSEKSINANPDCRLFGPIIVSPSENTEQYIKDAFEKELKHAGKYSSDSSIGITANITDISFSSFSHHYCL